MLVLLLDDVLVDDVLELALEELLLVLVVSSAVEEKLDEPLLVLDVVFSAVVDELVVSVSDVKTDEVVIVSSSMPDVGPEVDVEVDDDSSVE